MSRIKPSSVPRAAIAQLGKMSDPEIAEKYGVPLDLVRAERKVRGIPRIRRGGRQRKPEGQAR